MENIITVFVSRTETMRFSEFMTRNGIVNSIVNTPRDLSLGCGISVTCDSRYLNTVNYLLANYDRKYSLKGVYRMVRTGIRSTCIPI